MAAAKDYIYYLFDFDLTLANSSRGIVMCFTHVLQRHGYTEVTELQIKRTIGKTLEESFTLLTGVNDTAQLAAWKKEYTQEADIYMNDNTALFPETVSVLTKLKEQGAKLAIISTKYRYRIQAVIDKHFPKGFIDVIIGGEDVKAAKPDPQGVKAALKKLKATKELALYVGDSTVDAETARNAGIDFCGVLNGLTTYDELAAYPNRQILPDLSLLPLLMKSADTPGKTTPFLPTQWEIKRRAFNIKQIRGKQSKPLAKVEQHICQNCGDVYEGDFCRSCGQSAQTERITLKNTLSLFFSSFFNIESGFLHTIHDLWYRPGYMVADYVRGKRKPYYKPFSLLILMAAIYIVVGHMFNPGSVDKDKQEQPAKTETKTDSLAVDLPSQNGDSVLLSINDFSLSQDSIVSNEDSGEEKDYDYSLEPLKQWYREHSAPGTIIYALMDLMEDWKDNHALTFIIVIPFYIISTRLAFRHTRMNRRLNTGEYTFIFAYFGSQLIMKDMALMPFIGSDQPGLATHGFTINIIAEFLIMLRNFRQLFRLSWRDTMKLTAKTYINLVFYMLAFIAIAIVLIVLIVIMLARLLNG
ncbi:MAG: HAD-IA family hydrolase [Bacteroidaceae bacterium]|nr:HAD-IA family hydrolase [Bacteroidaceae bacterium]